jgi:serine/threonine-protein kinase RsbW
MAPAEIETSSDLSELGRICAFVRDFCRRAPGPVLDDEGIVQLELAVNEAASNIMRHSYGGRTDQRILIKAEALGDGVSIRLYDFGKSFDPKAVAAPSFDGTRDHGFGVFMIARAVDQVTHSRDADGRNCIHLMKKSKRNPGGQ